MLHFFVLFFLHYNSCDGGDKHAQKNACIYDKHELWGEGCVNCKCEVA